MFHVFGEDAIAQWIALCGVLAALIVLNEVSRRTNLGGIFMFFILPSVLTIYFVAITV